MDTNPREIFPDTIPGPSGVSEPSGQPNQPKSAWKRFTTTIGAGILFLLSKLKFLLLGLTKLKTLFSMFAFFGFYWMQYGWPFALGLVVSIYIHEMGHVSALRKLNIAASAPMFIPLLGAFVSLREPIDDPAVDAKIGLAGPIYGLGAGLLAYIAYYFTQIEVLGAIAHVTAYINLFNLIPVWQLDGARGFHALTKMQRWIAVAVVATAFFFTHEGILLFIGGFGVYKTFKPAPSEPNVSALRTYVILIVALSALALVRI